MNLQNRKRLIDLENEPMVAGGRDIQGAWDGHAHTAIFTMENQQGPAAAHRELCSMWCAAWVGGEWGRMDTRTCMAESPQCSPATITTLLTGYTRTPNKKFLKIGCMEKFGYRLNIR